MSVCCQQTSLSPFSCQPPHLIQFLVSSQRPDKRSLRPSVADIDLSLTFLVPTATSYPALRECLTNHRRTQPAGRLPRSNASKSARAPRKCNSAAPQDCHEALAGWSLPALVAFGAANACSTGFGYVLTSRRRCQPDFHGGVALIGRHRRAAPQLLCRPARLRSRAHKT